MVGGEGKFIHWTGKVPVRPSARKEKVGVKRTLTYIDCCRGSTLSTSERRIQEIEDGEKREKTIKLSALYTQPPPSILR